MFSCGLFTVTMQLDLCVDGTGNLSSRALRVYRAAGADLKPRGRANQELPYGGAMLSFFYVRLGV